MKAYSAGGAGPKYQDILLNKADEIKKRLTCIRNRLDVGLRLAVPLSRTLLFNSTLFRFQSNADPSTSAKPKLPANRKVEWLDTRTTETASLTCPLQGFPVPVYRYALIDLIHCDSYRKSIKRDISLGRTKRYLHIKKTSYTRNSTLHH